MSPILGLRVSIEEGIEIKENAVYQMRRECLEPMLLFASCSEGTQCRPLRSCCVAVSLMVKNNSVKMHRKSTLNQAKRRENDAVSRLSHVGIKPYEASSALRMEQGKRLPPGLTAWAAGVAVATAAEATTTASVAAAAAAAVARATLRTTEATAAVAAGVRGTTKAASAAAAKATAATAAELAEVTVGTLTTATSATRAATAATTVRGLASDRLQEGRDLLVGLLQELNKVSDHAAVATVEERSGNTSVSSTTRATDAVDVVINVGGEVVVDDVGDIGNIQTTGSNSSSDQDGAATVAEELEGALTLTLSAVTVNGSCGEALVDEEVG